MYTLAEETAEDWWEVEALYDLCFAPGREALSSYRLRDGVDPVPDLSLVARDGDGVLAGAIRYWPVLIDQSRSGSDSEKAAQPDPVAASTTQALLLGPIAVHPTRQGEGLGGALIRESLQRAALAGWARVMLVGDAPYYQRFGFTRLDGVEMPPPTNPDRVLGYRQEDGAWAGVAGRVVPFKTQTG